jgi:hypothetical protein
VPEIGLDGARVVAVVGQLEPADVPQHVGMNETAFSVSPVRQKMAGETVRTVRIVRARDSPLWSNGFASCPAVDGVAS